MKINFEDTLFPIVVCIYGANTWGNQFFKEIYQKLQNLPKKIEKVYIKPLPIKYRREGDNLLFFNGQQGFLMNSKGKELYNSILKEKLCIKSISKISKEELYFLIWCYLFNILDLKFKCLNNPQTIDIDELLEYPHRSIKYNIKLNAPISIVWLVSETCPFKCIYCHSDMKNYKSEHPIVNLSEADVILKKLKDYNIFRIYLSGGEPLANPNFPEIFRKSKNMGFYTSFNTNGYFLTTQLAEKLKKSGVNTLHISINCLNNDFEKITGCTQEINKIVINNLKNSLKFWSPDHIYLQIVGTNIAIRNIEKTLLYYIKLGFCNFRIVRFIPTYPEMKKYIPSIKDTIELQNIVNKIKSIYKHCTIDVALPPPFCNLVGNRKKTPNVFLPQSFSCPAGKFELCILANGDVIPCISFIRNKSELYCGNILTQNISEIFNNKKLKEFKNLDNSKIKICKNCEYSDICYSCRCVSYNWSKSLYDPDYSCYLINRQI